MDRHVKLRDTALAARIRRLRTYFEETIWRSAPRGAPPARRLGRRLARVAYLLARGFRDDRLLVHAPALSLFTLLGLVPLLALTIAVSNAFGFEKLALERVRVLLTDFVAVGQRDVADVVVSYIDGTSFGALGSIGLLFLVWIAVTMLTTIESTFNDIWGVARSRPLHRKVTDYLSVLLIFPLLLLASTGITATFSSSTFVRRMHDVGALSGAGEVMVKLLPIVAVCVALTFLYKFMPYTTVHLRAAAAAGLFAGLGWHGAQWAFIRFQIGVTSNNLIYGTFAALPIFLVWLNTSWIIVLVGCEIAYAVQHEATYHPPVSQGAVSIAERERAALQVLAGVWERFRGGKPPLLAGDIAAELDLPRPVALDVLRALIECGLLAQASPDERLLPARDLSLTGVGDLLVAFRHAGRLRPDETEEGTDARVAALHGRLEEALRSAGTQPVGSLTGAGS